MTLRDLRGRLIALSQKIDREPSDHDLAEAVRLAADAIDEYENLQKYLRTRIDTLIKRIEKA